MLILFSGVSGSGKNTVINEILKVYKDFDVLSFSSATTRAPRESDKEFNTYVYLSEDDFKKGLEEGKFFEHEIVHGNYYGILNEALKKVEKEEKHFLRDIDVHGQKKLKDYFKNKGKLLSIFLDAPNDELEKRLRARGESEADIEKRLARSAHEREYKKNFDLIVENTNLDKTIKTICEFLDKKL